MPVQGALLYSLGLDASVFSTGLNQGLELLGKFKAQMGGVAAAITREWSEAANLSDMSKKLRMLGSDVAALQAGLKVTVGGDQGIFQMFRFMRRAIGEAEADGGKILRVFEAMGLSLGQLQSMPAAEQLILILERLQTLNESSQVIAAQSIFGRSIEDVMLLSTKTQELRDVMARFAPVADLQARMAGQANQMLDQWTMIKMELKSIATIAAAELLPAVRAVVGLLNQINVGSKLGEIHNFAQYSMGMMARMTKLPFEMAKGKNALQIIEQLKLWSAESLAEITPFRAPPPLPPPGTSVIPADTAAPATAAPTMRSTDADPWTRIGAVLYGVGGQSTAEAQRQTARHTEVIAQQSRRTADATEVLSKEVQDVVDFIRDLTGHQ